MTLYFDNHEITIQRYRRKGSSNRFAHSATFTAYRSDIQPADIERAQLEGERFGAVFSAWVEADCPVKEGDIIVTTSDGKKYSVRGVEYFAGAGLLDHKELLIIAKDAT